MSIFATSRYCIIALKCALTLFMLVAFFACETNHAHAAPVPQLVKNIATTPNGSSPSLHTASTSAGFFLLLADDPESGSEWWRSDGTSEGTTLISDIEPGSSSASGVYYGFIDPYWIIAPYSSLYGQELWRTDGTEAGTSIILDSRSGTSGFSINAGNVVQVGNMIYYAANNTGATAINLWRTDGTESGTMRVSNTSLRMAQYSLVNLNDLLIFSAAPSIGSNNELWSSNGTATGTVLVKEIRAGSQGSSPANFTVSTTSVFFTANDNLFGNELWKTDGTATGTYMVKDINTGSSSPTFTNFRAHGGLVYFGASDSTNGIELWKSDGTEAGTVMVKDINPGLASSSPAIIATLGNDIIFTADDGVNGIELWKSDGTEEGTVMIKDINASGGIAMFSPTAMLNGTTLILGIDDGASGRELWKTDGTTLGTTRIKDIYTGSSSSLTTYAFSPSLFSPSAPPVQFVSFGPYVYFSADDGVNGRELWKTDGTEEGTVMVKNIADGDVGSSVSRFLFRDDEAYFYAHDQVLNYGLWQTDGTESGTTLVIPSFSPAEVLGKMGEEFYFFRSDGISGTELWKTDFTEGGTVMVKDINAGSASSLSNSTNDRNSLIISDKLFFSAITATSGLELWVSDGTESGTVMVKDIRSGSTGSGLSGFVAGTSSLYFLADDGTNGKELWTSDGTDAGTYMVKNLAAGANGTLINSGHFQGDVLNGVLYLSMAITGGYDLIRTDGTANGTYLVKDLPSGSSQAIIERIIVSSNEYVYFVGNSDAGNGNEASLWRSDGTTEGTVPIHQLKTTSSEAIGIALVPTTRGIYYSFDHPLYGYEWWYTDGFSTTSTPLADIGSDTVDGAYAVTFLASSGSGYNSRSLYYENVGETLYFIGSDSEHGRELWKTDGTPEGTYLVADIAEGLVSSMLFPSLSFQEATHKLYFGAGTPQYGTELYVMSLTPTTTLSSITTSSISKTGATVSTSITDAGFARATERGFNYGTTLAYGSGTSTTGLYSLSTFEYDMTDLTCNTTYYVQAFAVNAYGTTTQTTSFTTSACDASATPSTPSRRSGGGSSIRTTTTPVVPTTPTPTLITTPATPSTQQTGTTYTRDLSFGSTGTDVIALQRLLNSRGFTVSTTGPGSPGNEINVFGSKTQAALARFQTSVGITPASGYFGPITRTFVNALGTPIQAPSQTTYNRDLFLGSRGSDVTSLQNFLIQQGYLESGYATGYFGQLTQAALIKFQQANNISPALGYFGPKTRGVVGNR